MKSLNTVFALLTVILLMTVSACEKIPVDEPGQKLEQPVITSVSPLSGEMNTAVTILGHHFTASGLETEITFNGIRAQIDSISDSTMIIRVPPRADTGRIMVRIDTLIARGPVFNYLFSRQVSTIYHSRLKTYSYSCSDTASGKEKMCSGSYYDDALSLAVNSNGELYAYFPGDGSIRKIEENDTSVYVFKSDSLDYIYKDTYMAGGADGMIFDDKDNLYISDHSSWSIKKLTPSGELTTLAGGGPGFRNGPGDQARFGKGMNSIAVNKEGYIYVADISNFDIRQISPSGQVTTLAGGEIRGSRDGVAGQATFDRTNSICIDHEGNIVVAEYFLGKLRKITPQGTVTTMPGITLPLASILCTDLQGNMYVYQNSTFGITKISLQNNLSDFAGNGQGYKDGPANQAQFSYTYDMCVSPSGEIYVTDIGNHCIRKIAWE